MGTLGTTVVNSEPNNQLLSEFKTMENNSILSSMQILQKLPLLSDLESVTEKYENLTTCMKQQESSGGVKNYNPKDTDGKEKFGCLHFDKDTFSDFCVKKYYLATIDNIMDCNIQTTCSSLMIEDGYIGRWGKRTLNNCYN